MHSNVLKERTFLNEQSDPLMRALKSDVYLNSNDTFRKKTVLNK